MSLPLDRPKVPPRPPKVPERPTSRPNSRPPPRPSAGPRVLPHETYPPTSDSVKHLSQGDKCSSPPDSENHLPHCPRCEECVDYKCFIECSQDVTMYFSRKACLVVDEKVRDSFNPAHNPEMKDRAMDFLLNKIDEMVHTFDEVVNREPKLVKNIKGRYPIEVSYIRAAGLANHGVKGIAMGPAYPQQMYEDAQKCVDDPSHTFRYNHCMLYEHTRNYIFPDEFTKVFEYSLDDTDSNYGWTNQGFIDILGCLLLDHMCSDGEKVELEYYGNNRDGFMISMEEELDNYLKHEYSYEETFEHHLLPWNQNKSLDNVIAGILSRFYREFGYGFMLRWFRCIPLLQKRLPPRSLKPCDRQSGIDNFYIAASFGACCDQYDYFCGSLQWPVSDDGREFYEKHKSDNLYDK